MAQEAGVEMTRVNGVEGADASTDRSIDDIRQDIERSRQRISGTVDTLGAKLQEQLDWREYIRRKPFVAVGVGLGAGLVISRMVVRRRKAPATLSDLIADTVAKTVRQITQPKQESFAAGAFKMFAGLVATQIAQSLQPDPEEEEHDEYGGQSRDSAVRN